MKYFIECTHTYHTRMNSGIQRVVRNIVRSSAALDNADDIIPVVFDGEGFSPIGKHIPYPTPVQTEQLPLPKRAIASAKRSLRWTLQTFRKVFAKLIPFQPFVTFLYAPRTQWGLSRVLLLPFGRAKGPNPQPKREWIDVKPGDVLVLLDSSWHLNIWKAVDESKRCGALIVVVIYDLIPWTSPQFCVPALVQSFNSWVRQAATRVDAVIAISETIALDFRNSLPKIAGAQQRMPAVSYFWLGSELDGEQTIDKEINPDIERVCAERLPTYVYVSTVEPRKNHGYALDAFEILWNKGIRANFVIVGRIGWKCEELVERVRNHKQFGKQLFMFNSVEDNELAYLYDNVHGLIFTSVAEGFGLPIVEGLQRGLPVFASDIPVFREIGQQGVRFVDLTKPSALTDAIAAHIESGAPRLHTPVSWLSWQDSTEQLYTRIRECLTLSGRATLKESAPATQ